MTKVDVLVMLCRDGNVGKKLIVQRRFLAKYLFESNIFCYVTETKYVAFSPSFLIVFIVEAFPSRVSLDEY